MSAWSPSGRAIFTPAGGTPDYFDEQGRSLKRFFLKSPLKFDPIITSRFTSHRKHPVLGFTRAHLGVDFRAPTGAPVVAVADGLVVSASFNGGGGPTPKVGQLVECPIAGRTIQATVARINPASGPVAGGQRADMVDAVEL